MGFKKAKQDEEIKEPEVQEPEEVEETEEAKKVTVNDVLSNHEERIVKMEAKMFRLGGV